jgi:hypothetical protein
VLVVCAMVQGSACQPAIYLSRRSTPASGCVNSNWPRVTVWFGSGAGERVSTVEKECGSSIERGDAVGLVVGSDAGPVQREGL